MEVYVKNIVEIVQDLVKVVHIVRNQDYNGKHHKVKKRKEEDF